MANSLHVKHFIARSFLGFCLAAALVIAPTHRAEAQASEFFDSFFSDNAGQPAQNFKGFIQWNVTDPANATNSSVDFVGGNVPGSFFYPTGRFVDLGGSTGQPAIFSTKLPIVLALGTSYTLTYRIASTEAVLALGGPGANTLITPTPDGPLDTARITVGGNTFTLSTSSNTFQTFTLDFVATAATDVLALQDLGFVDPSTGVTRFDNSGVGLDMIAVTPQGVPAIPEPTTTAALALAMVCVGAAARARRQARC